MHRPRPCDRRCSEGSDLRRWIGVPYRAGGRGPDAWDCYGLVASVLRAWGMDVPLWAGLDGRDSAERGRVMAALRDTAGSGWRAVAPGDVRRGDVPLLRVAGAAAHCGVIVETIPGPVMLHVLAGPIGACLAPLDTAPWRQRWVGTYRYQGGV